MTRRGPASHLINNPLSFFFYLRPFLAPTKPLEKIDMADLSMFHYHNQLLCWPSSCLCGPGGCAHSLYEYTEVGRLVCRVDGRQHTLTHTAHTDALLCVGEDAVSWLQSECGPCSAEEALAQGNQMIAAGLIYHCNYGHSLENNRLFYK